MRGFVMRRIPGLLMILQLPFGPTGCDSSKDGKANPEKNLRAFSRFETRFSIPKYDSAFEEHATDLPGCSIGLSFKIRTVFRSTSVVEHYSDFFRKAGMIEDPVMSQGSGEWRDLPAPRRHYPEGARLLINQKAFFTEDKGVECVVAASYIAVSGGDSAGTVRALDSAQGVSVGCHPRLPPENNPCLGRPFP